jgi:phosphoglycolate phosphatase
MTKHIIWDWNGTLLDDVEACVNSINNMLAPRKLPTITISQYRDIFDFPVKNYYKDLGFDMENENWDSMAKEFHRHYANFSAKAKLRQDAVTTLTELHKQGIPMSILSASEITILERMLNTHNIRTFFSHVFGLDNLYASSKLERGQRLLQKLNTPPQEILIIGDTNHDHEVAQELGINCILLTGGHQSEARLKSNTIIHSPKELIKTARLENLLVKTA